MLFAVSPTEIAAAVEVHVALFLAVTALSGSAPVTPAAVEATDLLPKATAPCTTAVVLLPIATASFLEALALVPKATVLLAVNLSALVPEPALSPIATLPVPETYLPVLKPTAT